MKHPTDEVVIRFATRLMWASLALALGVGLGFAWRASCLPDERSGKQTRFTEAAKEVTRHEPLQSGRP
jgi:hypothetical protein